MAVDILDQVRQSPTKHSDPAGIADYLPSLVLLHNSQLD